MKARLLLVGILGVGAVLFCLATLGGGSRSSGSSSYRPAPTSDTWRPPSGFTKHSPSVAYRWLSDDEFRCQLGDRCTAVEVVTRYACSSLYGEVTILENGVNVDWTNDSASGVRPGERTQLQFEWFGRGSSTRIAELSCDGS